jgi:sarcosine oxidase subunit gamma
VTVDSDVAALRRSPLGHLADVLAAGSAEASVMLHEVPFLAQVNVRVEPGGAAAARIAAALGVPLPAEPGTVATAGSRAVLWLGPDEWLVVGPEGDAAAIERLLRTALGDDRGSVVDVSANRTTLELSGPSARDVLEKGCSLDLHPRSFQPGRCAQTLLARSQVILWQTTESSYRLLVRGSFAEYVAEWLLDAMTEFRNLESRQ